MLAYIVFLVVLHVVLGEKPFYEVDDYGVVGKTFENFIEDYKRSYEGHEKIMRFGLFIEHLKLINKLNREYNAIHDINQFADMSLDEKAWYNGYRRHSTLSTAERSSSECDVLNDPQTRDAPASWDWRKHGAVSPVKNQDTCGSCWAFATIGVVESRYWMGGKHVSLSEQQLVDCVPETSCREGGEVRDGLETIMSEGGVESEAAYPYENRQKKCRFDKSKVAATITSCNIHNITNEDALKELLYKNGPVTVAVAASSFHSYHGGILDNCDSVEIDHAVLLVGYGTEGTEDYWIIKNSWGKIWGEKGFIRIKRGVNCCRIIDDEIGIMSAVI